jgi:UDPglucose--hexose-1-phosphate uridylyltransferase
LCPGNERAAGVKNPIYKGTFVFDNDFAALLPDTPGMPGTPDMPAGDGLFVAQPEKGLCRVICFSPRHDLTLALMNTADIVEVVNVWIEQFSDCNTKIFLNYVQIFENRGAVMGCSNPHPHGQIWANQTMPVIPAAEDLRQGEFFDRHKACLLCEYLKRELSLKERIVFENTGFVALVPFWAVWPFEVMLLPKFHATDITQLDNNQKTDFADALCRIAIRYDNLFKTSFPYSMGIHQRPLQGTGHGHWHFHVHYFPPLLRSATVKKFMVGYEMLAMPQRDITAEESARRLRDECSEVHYTQK